MFLSFLNPLEIKRFFENVSFHIKRGERVFLLGDNGCGKTTLLKILMQDYPASNGKFRFGANLFTGYFDQVQAKLDLNKTAMDEVLVCLPYLTETRLRKCTCSFFCSRAMRYIKT